MSTASKKLHKEVRRVFHLSFEKNLVQVPVGSRVWTNWPHAKSQISSADTRSLVSRARRKSSPQPILYSVWVTKLRKGQGRDWYLLDAGVVDRVIDEDEFKVIEMEESLGGKA